MKRLLILSLFALAMGHSLFAAKKLKFEPNFKGTYDGTFKDGKFEFDFKGEKIAGTMKTTTGARNKAKVVIELTIKDKTLKYEANTQLEMKEGIMGPVKCVLEEFTMSYGDLAFEGFVDKNELGVVTTEIKYKGKTGKGKGAVNKMNIDFGDFAIKGKRDGLVNLDYDVDIGAKKVLGSVEMKVEVFKGTMKGDYNFKLEGLNDDEFALALFFGVISENWSGRAR